MTSTIISLILCPTNPIESLPQETIDAIIDNLPRYSLPSSSLVARQWRTRSQQRILASITFHSQSEVGRWHSDVQGGQNKILSYVRSVQFRCINSWNDPALPGRVLKGFPSLTTLEVYGTVIPDELLDQTSRGEFDRTINNLQIRFPRCALSAIISMILSFPELKELTVSLEKTALEQPVSTSSVTQKRGSLDWLGLWGHTGGISEALIQLQFTSRHLCLGSNNSNAHRLLALSSETLVGLWLEDHDCTRTPIRVPIDLLPFPALTSLEICVREIDPTCWVTSVLSSITSAPALASIKIQHWGYEEYLLDPEKWDDMDRWLARVAERTTVERGPVVTLVRPLPFSVSPDEVVLPRFTEAGGRVNGYVHKYNV